MAVATPFKFLDRQMNNPVTDLSKITSTDVYNTIDNARKDISSAVGDLIGSIKEKAKGSKTLNSLKESTGGIGDSLSEGFDSVKGNYKELKNGIGAIKDITGNSIGALEDAIMGMLPVGVSRSSISSLARRCKDNMGMQNVLGKPWDVNGGCGTGGKSGCTSGGINNLLNSITDGGYGGIFKDINAILSGIVGLANLSYNVNLCGAFSALLGAADGLTNSQVARAGGAVLMSLSGKGNILGAADLSKSVVGLNVTSIAPKALDIMSTNAVKVSDKYALNVSERGLAGYDLIEDGWDKSKSSKNFSNRNVSAPGLGMKSFLRAGTMSTKVDDLDDFNVGSNASLYSSSLCSRPTSSMFNSDLAFASIG